MSDTKDKKPVENSLNYIFTGEKFNIWFSLICFVISFYAILPSIAIIGYLFDVRESAYKGERIPKFENYERLISQGYYGLVSYTPLIFLIIFCLILFVIYQPIAIGVSSLAIFIWPAISITYSLKRDYRLVYGPEIFDIVASEEYIKFWIIYTVINVVFIVIISVSVFATFGLSFFVLFPILLITRAAYWGHIADEIYDFEE